MLLFQIVSNVGHTSLAAIDGIPHKKEVAVRLPNLSFL